MPFFAILIMLSIMSTPLLADSQRSQFISQQLKFNDTDETRLERIGQSLSGPCSCSEGEPLNATPGLLFNCTCGSMQCVVVGSRNKASAPDGNFNLFCR